MVWLRDAVGVMWLRDAVGVMWLRDEDGDAVGLRDEDGDAVGELDVGARSGKRGKGRGGSLVVWL